MKHICTKKEEDNKLFTYINLMLGYLYKILIRDSHTGTHVGFVPTFCRFFL